MTDLSHLGDTLVEVRDLLVRIATTLDRLAAPVPVCGEQKVFDGFDIRYCQLDQGHAGKHDSYGWVWDPTP